MSNSSHQTISLEKAYEVRHWMRTFRLSELALHLAVMAVGRDPADVAKFAECQRRTALSSLCP